VTTLLSARSRTDKAAGSDAPEGATGPPVDTTHRAAWPVTRIAGRGALAAIGVLAAVGVWAVIALAVDDAARVPTPLGVWRFVAQNAFHTAGISYAGISGSLWSNTLFTVRNTVEGFLFGAVIGYGAGLVLGARTLTMRVANSLLVLYASIPAVILTPFVVIWFGPDGTAELVVVAFYVFVLVAIAAQNSAKQLSDTYTTCARSLGARRRDVVLHLLVPGCLPAALAVGRIALAVGWGLEVATELFGANQGIGRLVLYYQQTGSPAGIIGCILLLAAMALVIELLLRLALAAATVWQERTSGGAL
jgi:ABC-type nitrate/sulfonate/bicarbonate transport system permease component